MASMKYLYDLQAHTNLSDGHYGMTTAFRLAKKQGLKAISFTDHNTASYFDEKNRLAHTYTIVHIEGIEISTKFNEVEVHILGYSQHFKSTILKKALEKTINGYNARSEKMVAKLNAAGVTTMKFSNIQKKKARFCGVTKYDIARAVAPSSKFSQKEIAKMLNNGGLAAVPYGNWAMTPVEATQLIHRAGGIVSLSHPGETKAKYIKKFGEKKGVAVFSALLKFLLKAKIDGLEVYSPKNTAVIRAECIALTKKYRLITTGGSDWHGEPHHPDFHLGDGGLSKKLFDQFCAKLKIKNK